jgi:hypothetical protein
MKSLLTQIRENVIGIDSLSKRGDVFTARLGYFYTHGKNAEDFATSVQERVQNYLGIGSKVKIVDSGDHWAPFRGGASTAKSSHWWVRFKVVPNRDMVETYNMLNPEAGVVMIEAYLKGGCCDPATNLYHSM